MPPPCGHAQEPLHPRVGGEHPLPVADAPALSGSSPRGRGTRIHPQRQPESHWFIPAWAGNTVASSRHIWMPTVHPRVGGEHSSGAVAGRYTPGSSPRGRGTPATERHQSPAGRFIPAWAGNTQTFAGAHILPSVHPRVGGEHPLPVADAPALSGSSPRGRGTLIRD